jgi:hypothetical protein
LASITAARVASTSTATGEKNDHTAASTASALGRFEPGDLERAVQPKR